MPSSPAHVLFVDDDVRLHRIVPLVAAGHPLRFTCVSTSADALARMRVDPPDLALVDLGLPDLDGVELIEQLVTRMPGLAIVVLSVATTEARIVAALTAGACGYIVKEDLGTRLLGALEDALRGGVPMSTVAARVVLERVRRARRGVTLPSRPAEEAGECASALSLREREVVEHLGRGLTYSQVGQVLGVTINTVRTHVRAVYDKLGAGSRTEAIQTAVRQGIVPPP